MTPPPVNPPELPVKKILIPLIVSLILGLAMFYGGEAYQVMGLAALQNTIVVFGYVLGISEFLILAILVQRIVQHIILDRLVSAALGAPTPRLLSQLANVIIYSLALGAIVGVVFKKDLTVILTAFGGASLVIGLALQGLIHDLFAGLTINLDRSIKMGDFIYLNKGGDYTVEGEVKEISWRTMRLLDTNNNIIIIPNSQVSSSVITNFSAPADFFEIGIVITLDIEVPVEKALTILRTAATEASPQFSPRNAPAPSVSVRAITLQGVEYSIFVFPTFKTRARARNLVQQQVLRHLNFAGLTTARAKQEMRTFIGGFDYHHYNMVHIAKLLGETGLFQDLTKAELQLLADSSIMRKLPANALLVQGGEIATSMFLVIEGLLIADEWRKKVGRRTEIEDVLLGPGYLISSAAMLAGDSYDSTIKSKTAALLCEINYAAIEAILLQKPDLGSCLSRRVAEEINQAVARGEHSRYGQENLNDVAGLTAKVFKNLRRSFAHLELS